MDRLQADLAHIPKDPNPDLVQSMLRMIYNTEFQRNPTAPPGALMRASLVLLAGTQPGAKPVYDAAYFA